MGEFIRNFGTALFGVGSIFMLIGVIISLVTGNQDAAILCGACVPLSGLIAWGWYKSWS